MDDYVFLALDAFPLSKLPPTIKLVLEIVCLRNSHFNAARRTGIPSGTIIDSRSHSTIWMRVTCALPRAMYLSTSSSKSLRLESVSLSQRRSAQWQTELEELGKSGAEAG
jgi:hypothetical protein